MVYINWALWKSKEEAINYIAEMKRIGIKCRLFRINDSDWQMLSEMFGEHVERGYSNV